MGCRSCTALASAPAAADGAFDPAELRAGCQIELEHTSDPDEACQIAKVHLQEDRHYYSKLCSLFPGEAGCQFVPKKTSWGPAIVFGLGVLTLLLLADE